MERQKQKKFLVGIGFGFILAGLSALLLQNPESPGTARRATLQSYSEKATPDVNREEIGTLKMEIERLKHDRGQLVRRSESMDSELAALRARVKQGNQRVGTPAFDTTTDEPALMPEEAAIQAEAQVQAQIDLLEGALRVEAIDPKWTGTAELALHEAFQSEDVKGVQLVEAQCRTTLCRMEFVLDGSASPEENFRSLVDLVPWQGQGFGQFDLEESGGVVIYLAREGHSLPQPME